MWPFTKPEPSRHLEVRLERIERDMRDLQTDWEATYEKFSMLLKRWNKRLRDTETREPDAGRGDGRGGRDLVSGRGLSDVSRTVRSG